MVEGAATGSLSAGGRPPRADTIVAPATAPGPGERSLLRLSGPGAFALASAVAAPGCELRPGRVAAGRIDAGDGLSVPVLLLPFRAPRSFTGEDVVELHLPGWPALVTEALARLVAAGARPAQRGEFPRRAIATGRLDLERGLALGRLVAARDAEQAAAAAAALSGEGAMARDALRESLLGALTLVEAHLDFEEEDTEAVDAETVRSALARVRAAAVRLARLGVGPPADGETDVVLLGPPNAGKSALFLALCPGACTTVSPLPGTTRDRLEAHCAHGGRRLRLVDGPGLEREALREALRSPAVAGKAEAESIAELDRAAMAAFARSLPPCAVVVDVEDGARPSPPSERAARRELAGCRPRVRVLSKADLPGFAAVAGGLAAEEGAPRLAVCAPRGEGLEALRDALLAAAPAPGAPDVAGLLAGGDAGRLLAELESALATASGPVGPADALPLVSLVLRDALARLSSPGTGPGGLAEEVLDRVFAGFCIGK